MQQYELTFLLPGESEIHSLKEIVSSLEGKIIKEDKWGEKTLSYPIKKKVKAYYYQWIIQLSQNKAMELRKKLQFNEKLIRYLLLAVNA